MLLFSTLLEINDTMTQDAFIQLVLEWNQGSPHEANIIQGIEWHGERNVRYGTDKMWLAIEEYRNENIIAVRYEKTEEDGVVWDTDYVMNFNEMKMSIRLDRSYLESALSVDPKFSTPHFITLLINGGYLKKDGDLPILRTPILVDEPLLEVVSDIINGNAHYQLPVVYVSKTYEEKDPVDVWKLAGRLKGVAHVLVQKTSWSGSTLRRLCDSKNEYNGAIGVYFPNQAVGHQKFLNHQYVGSETKMAEKVIRSVIQYCNAQRTEVLYTWQGVNNSLLRDRYSSKKDELAVSESALEQNQYETDALLQMADQDAERMRQQIAELTRQNDALTYEVQGLRNKLSSIDSVPVLYLGGEDELFQGEIKEILLEILSNALSSIEPNTRRADVLGDIIRSNGDVQGTIAEKAQTLKATLNGYKSLNGSKKRILSDLGFEINEDGRHYKLTYYGDGRYMATLAKTPSDNRSGMNIALEMIKNMF